MVYGKKTQNDEDVIIPNLTEYEMHLNLQRVKQERNELQSALNIHIKSIGTVDLTREQVEELQNILNPDSDEEPDEELDLVFSQESFRARNHINLNIDHINQDDNPVRTNDESVISHTNQEKTLDNNEVGMHMMIDDDISGPLIKFEEDVSILFNS